MNNATTTPNYETARPHGHSELLDITDQRLRAVHAASGLAMQSVKNENISITIEVDAHVAVVTPRPTAQEAMAQTVANSVPYVVPETLYNKQETILMAQQQVAESQQPTGQNSYIDFLADHPREEFELAR